MKSLSLSQGYGVAFYGDPDELDRLAIRIRASAEDTRDHAQALSLRSMEVDWQSAAADEFRGTVERDVAALRHAADQLDEAAHLLRQHAERVRERLARIRTIEAAVTNWFGDQIRQLGQVAQDPPWRHWPWTPRSLPNPGDKEWLEVGEFLRRQGIPW